MHSGLPGSITTPTITPTTAAGYMETHLAGVGGRAAALAKAQDAGLGRPGALLADLHPQVLQVVHRGDVLCAQVQHALPLGCLGVVHLVRVRGQQADQQPQLHAHGFRVVCCAGLPLGCLGAVHLVQDAWAPVG